MIRLWKRTTYFAAVLSLLSAPTTGAESVIPVGATDLVPSYLLEVPDAVAGILIAETDSATLHRFSNSVDGVVARDQRYMSIGQNGVGKARAWDRKTPLGIYFITHRLDTSKLDAKYGDAAYPLDYPNAWDQFRKRTGYGIWLHGVSRAQPRRPPRDTDGCLALPNEELASLAAYLRPLETPIIVARALHWADPEEVEQRRLEFRIALDFWRQSLEQQDLAAYLSLYDDEFRIRGMDKDTWSAYRLGVFNARRLSGVEIHNLMLLGDPEEPDLFLSRFTQVLIGEGGPVTTTKRLYWKRRSSTQWRIVSEDNG
jgi:hypothetical protein